MSSSTLASAPPLRLPFQPDDIRRAERQRWWYWTLALGIHGSLLALAPGETLPLPLPLQAVEPLQAQLRTPTPEREVTPPPPTARPIHHPRLTAPSLAKERPSVVTPPPPAVAAATPSAAPAEAVPAPRSTVPPPIIAARFDADYLHNPKPVYPALSRRLHEEGKVLVSVRVGLQGQALETLLQKSSGFPRLDHAALDAVARWRFIPARRGEEAVESWVSVPLLFMLDQD